MTTTLELLGGPADGLQIKIQAPLGVEFSLPELTLSRQGGRPVVYYYESGQWRNRALFMLYRAEETTP